jgi:hypothetical protein
MNNVIFIDLETKEGIKTYAVIDKGNGEYTSMLKSTWDKEQLSN